MTMTIWEFIKAIIGSQPWWIDAVVISAMILIIMDILNWLRRLIDRKIMQLLSSPDVADKAKKFNKM